MELELLLAGRNDKTHPILRRSVYQPLGDYLKSTSEEELRLTLDEIEKILGRELPKEAETHQFWANVDNHHQSRRGQWLDAGYDAFFDVKTRSVRFLRRVTQDQEVSRELPTSDPKELMNRAHRARRRLEAATSSADPPAGVTDVEQVLSAAIRWKRDPEVVAWVLSAAGGVCEVCENPAPFSDADGDPFLEVHHVRPLGEGGPDRPDNAIAVCPNCHRLLHFGADREATRNAVLRKVLRLTDYPVRAFAEGERPSET